MDTITFDKLLLKTAFCCMASDGNIDKREIQVEAGKWLQTIFNTYIEKPFEEYDINYDYYLGNIKKEIDVLEPKVSQLSLF